MAEMTVPLVSRGNGLWGSPSPAWDHLINRESSGRPYVIQEIHDVNSGGNEAEGLFQITPKTWARHNGTDFAPSARHATPQQQAIVAARIFTRNPTGSDWGAGRPGREDPRDLASGLVPVGAAPAPVPAPAVPQSYGLPRGSNSGGYGNTGVRFPDWVYALGNAFGLKPSTYPGHQESNRNEAGYAPNPQGLNRGIDWAAPGAPDEVDRMQRFADYLFSIRGELEQVIWWNPQTNKRIGVAGGKDVTTTPYYDYPGGYDDHRDHVHTRQSHSIPLPGGAAPAPVAARPAFTELEMFGKGASKRSRPPMNFFIHTEEGDGSAKSLAEYCQGQNGVSYHYTLRDGIVYDVVDTDLYSWSVLEANIFSVNLCFAGSRAAFTREQWLQRERDIEIAAYLAVQDARKYNFSTEVLVPRWDRQGADTYAGSPRAGISDHNYVTRELGIGDHTDVGRNFPWDVFIRYVNKYANPITVEEGFLMALSDQQQRELYDAICGERVSKSPLRAPGEGNVGQLRDLIGWIDGSVHWQALKTAAEAGHPNSLLRLQQIANIDLNRYPDRAEDSQLANAILADMNNKPQQAVVSQAAPVDNSRELAAAYAEIDRLRAENTRLAAEAAQATSAAVSTAVVYRDGSTDGTLGQRVGQFVDSVSQLDLAAASPIEERATLSAAIKVLATKNGSDL